MIKLENTEVIGWEHAIRGMRNPKNSWKRSDTEVVIDYHSGIDTIGEGWRTVDIGSRDHELMMTLASGGPVHAKYRRMIAVYVDIIAPLYWWKEFDTYKVGTVANSCSTMHKIHDKEFTLEDFSCEHLFNDLKRKQESDDYDYLRVFEIVVDSLNDARDMFLKTKDKKYWWQMIQLLPSSYNQKRTVMLNYEVLANIYEWRKNHKLDEWRTLCEWIEKLPYSEIICGPEFLRKRFNVEKEESEAVKLKEVGEAAVEGITIGLSLDDIQKRANVRWYDDMMTDTRVVISRGDEPLTGDEKAMLTRMWENQGIRLRIEFKEE